jgi:hypothetical protein
LDGSREVLEPTGRHRLFSATRNDWVRTETLSEGEQLKTRDGMRTIASIGHRAGIHRVYNIEVETEHCYYVGSDLVLSHNQNACAALPPMKGMGAKEREKTLTDAGFNQTHVSNSPAKNETWSHADSSEVRVHPYGNVKQTPHKSGNNGHLHKQDPAGNQLDDRGNVSQDPNKTHIGVPNPRDFKKVRNRDSGS